MVFERRVAAVIVFAGCAALCGCARTDLPAGLGASVGTVRAADFAADEGSAARGASSARTEAAPTTRTVSREDAERGVVGVDRIAGQDPASALAPEYDDAAESAYDAAARALSAPGGGYLVDAKVGDLNGRPIFARAWLEQMADRLRARGAELPRSAWRQFAEEEIRKRLSSELTDQLLLAEARSALTPQQRQGLRSLLEKFERDMVSGAAGSRTLAERRLAEERGATLEQARRAQEERVLIEAQFRREIVSRVQVPWRDIRLEYERNSEAFNPPPRAVFRQVRVRTADTEAVDRVAGALAAGTPFDEVADLPVNERPDPVEREVAGAFEEQAFFGLSSLNEAARGLSPGEWAGPVTAGAFTYWVSLREIRSDSTPLYDAQLMIQEELLSRRMREQEMKYLYRLIRRTGMDDFGNVVRRLADVAEAWYYPGGRAN